MVWICPICAMRITENRRRELARLLNVGYRLVVPAGDDSCKTLAARRWFLALATFTIRHDSTEPMTVVLGRLKRAYRKTFGGRWAVGFKSRYLIRGMLRSIEPTHGSNGWHPHIHTLLISDSHIGERTAAEMMVDLQVRWAEMVESVGGSVDVGRGVDVQAGDNKANEYLDKMGQAVAETIGKWSTIAEFTKTPVKRGRAKPGEQPNRTLWDLLAAYIAGDVQAGRLWIEGTAALRGTAQIMASPGLWKLLESKLPMTDESLAVEETRPTDVLLNSLTLDQWRAVIRADARGELLEIAGAGDPVAVAAFVKRLETT